MEVVSKWSGGSYSLCCGSWNININGKVLVSEDKHSVLNESMNVYGTYDTWEFDEDYSEEWSTYSDGLHLNDWIKSDIANRLFLLVEENGISLTRELKVKLYDSFVGEDWRHNSCGGCI
jgi:hypothetical protein